MNKLVYSLLASLLVLTACFEDEGNYFQVEIVESNEDFPHYTLCIWQDEQLLVEYSLYTGEDYE